MDRALAIAEGEHAVMVLDGAGWRCAKALATPPNVSLPSCSSQLKPMQRVWPRSARGLLSRRDPESCDAIVDACRSAWSAIADDADRIRSLCLSPCIRKVIG